MFDVCVHVCVYVCGVCMCICGVCVCYVGPNPCLPSNLLETEYASYLLLWVYLS